MTIAFLNGDYLPLEEARISPLDRGFLFGDGIYEVIPVHGGKPIGFSLHYERLRNSLSEVEIGLDWTLEQWRDVCGNLIDKSGGGDLSIYLQVSRGADTKRHHAFPVGVTPTVFGFASELVISSDIKPLKISSAEDQRWKRCNIKSTALLGNIIHFQKGQSEGKDETLLYNAAGEITEGSAANAFVIKEGVVATPPLDNQVLPGITRRMLLDMISKDGAIDVEERVVTMQEAREADEIWLTSSSKDVAPVVELDSKPVGTGQPGPLWETAQRLFTEKKFDY